MSYFLMDCRRIQFRARWKVHMDVYVCAKIKSVIHDAPYQPSSAGFDDVVFLNHCNRVKHICVTKLTNIGSNNGLAPDWRQASIWTNAEILVIGPLGTNISEILIEIYAFSFIGTPAKNKMANILQTTFKCIYWKGNDCSLIKILLRKDRMMTWRRWHLFASIGGFVKLT